MKLTNYMRDAFIRSVMLEVPKPDYDAIRKEFQEALYKAMSKDVRRVFRTAPRALRTWYSWDFADRGQREFVIGDVDVNEAAAPFLEKLKARDAFSDKLRRLVYGLSTDKQLRDALPELAHHLPKVYTTTPNLPTVCNVVADLVKLGWTPKVQVEGDQ